MNGFGNIIQFMFFIVIILIMAKVLGFADNGFAVIAACVVGGLAYGLIYFISSKISGRKKAKQSINTLKRGNTSGRNKTNK